MNKAFLTTTFLTLSLFGCQAAPVDTQKDTQAAKAKLAAESVKFSGNAEIENIKRRLELTSKPGALGYITLLNSAGQPILYTAVRGKVSSGTKRLTGKQYLVRGDRGPSYGDFVMEAPGDEGTYGASSPYVYFWDMDGKYHQWSGDYLYTSEPQRLRIEPLVILTQAPTPAPKAPI